LISLNRPFNSRFIHNQGTLAACLFDKELDEPLWLALGRLIGKMHLSGINHADLNANNILLTGNQEFFLIDFDKARIMKSRGSWADKNINRLLRSLNKIRQQRLDQGQDFHFSHESWSAFLSGYR